jgi:hypothetical protein
MGWIISVGRAGARGKGKGGQILSVCFDADRIPARVKVCADAGEPASQAADAVPSWQAQRVWRNVLSTLVGPD